MGVFVPEPVTVRSDECVADMDEDGEAEGDAEGEGLCVRVDERDCECVAGADSVLLAVSVGVREDEIDGVGVPECDAPCEGVRVLDG